MLKNILKIIFFFFLGVIGGIFADQILWPYFVERPLFYQYNLEKTPIYLTETKEVVIQENTALKEAIEKADKVAVAIRTKTKTGKIIEGSGLILTADGLVITLADLVPSGGNSFFFVEGEAVAFQILKRDLKGNLALIKIEKTNLPTVGFFDLEKLKLGERVFLLGLVFEENGIKKSVNEGIVKNFDQELIKTNISEEANLAGSSLFDIEGNFLGLNVISSGGQMVTIPVNKIKSFSGF